MLSVFKLGFYPDDEQMQMNPNWGLAVREAHSFNARGCDGNFVEELLLYWKFKL